MKNSYSNSSSALGGLAFAVGLFVIYNFMYSSTVPKYRYNKPNFSLHPAYPAFFAQ